MARSRGWMLLIAVVASSVVGFGVSTLSSPANKPVPTGTPGSGLVRGRASVPWVVSGYNGTPFGDLSVAPNGTLYFVDLEYGEIDEVTSHGARILVSSLSGGSNPNSSIPALGGLYATSFGIFFAAESSIYEATPSGHSIEAVSSAFGVVNLDVLGDGETIYYTTSNGVYERTGLNGAITRVAGGGSIGRGAWTNGKPATEIAEQPHDVIGLSATAFDFTTADNELDVVRNGALSESDVGFHNGEMTESAKGTIYAICGWSMCKINGTNFTPIFRIPTHADGAFAAPSGLAIAPNGDFYESFTNQSSPNGRAGILEMSSKGRFLRVVVVRNQHVYGG